MRTDSWEVADRGARVQQGDTAAVLVVDDDASKRLSIKAVLSPLGLSIIEADSGQAALRLVMEHDFAVILLDVRMPEMDGFETAALIRRRKQSEMTPIIFVTAYSGDELGPGAKYVSGAVDFMFAPIQADELRAKVSVFVNLHVEAATLAERAREVQVSVDHLRQLTDAAPIGIFRTDTDNKLIYTNPRWSEIANVPEEEAIGRDWDAIISSQRSSGTLLDAGDTEELPSGCCRYELTLPDSTSRIVLMTSEAVLDEMGETSGWVGTLADVTAEARADEERSRFQSLVQNSRDVIAIIDKKGQVSYASPGIFEISGFRPEEITDVSGMNYIHPDDIEVVAMHLQDIVSKPDATKTIEVRTRTKSGEWIWIEIRAVNRIDDPSIQGIVLNYHDITERREAAHRLAQSEKLMAEGQALSHLGSFVWDMRTDALSWSDEQYRLLGYEPGTVDATFETLLDRLHPEDRAEFVRKCQASMDTGVPFEYDMRVVIPDQPLRWIEGRGEVSKEDGTPVKMSGMSHDITARRDSEAERVFLLGEQRDLADQLRMLLDSTGEGIYGVTAGGVCTFMNQAGAALLGGDAERFVGEHVHELTHHTRPDGTTYPSTECPIVQGASNGEIANLREELVWRLDGTSFPADFSSYPIGGDGKAHGAVVTFQDVSLRLRMEEELRQTETRLGQAQKMEAVGRLAGGIAHDFNNILAVVLNYADFVADTLDEDHEARPDLAEIIKAGERARELVHQLLAFSRQEIIQPSVIDLNEVVDGMATLLERSVGEDIDLNIETASDLSLTEADYGQLEQILLNLVVNARDSMPEGGGQIKIITEDVSLEAGDRLDLEPGHYVCLTVTDSGSGIDPEILEHIFEPFFTTKERGEGTGLGLATVYGIVQRAHGGIYAESVVGVSTSFTVYLPVTNEAMAEPIELNVSAGPDDATILVVEDEAAVRGLIVRILLRAGFEVLDVGSGTEALELCSSTPGTIDLLLTDVVMPDISGPALRDLLRPLRPETKVLFMSGYTDDLIAKRGVLGAGEALIKKPFNSSQLLKSVREALVSDEQGPTLVRAQVAP